MWLFTPPTTGAFSFTDILIDPTSTVHTNNIHDTNQHRANLRALLKESKRTDGGERDYGAIVKTVDDYLPYLYAILHALQTDNLSLRSDPIFSWRTTLSSSSLQIDKNPRLDLPHIHSELLFTHLTGAFASYNHALTLVASLGLYERTRHLPEAERKDKDEKLNRGVSQLLAVSGVFEYLSTWDGLRDVVVLKKGGRPPEASREVLSALAKMTLAQAQLLAIRKLLSKATSESSLTPGPPLPKSHPSPVLLAKLYLEAASLFASAKSLASTPSSNTSQSASSSKFKLGLKKKQDSSTSSAATMNDFTPSKEMAVTPSLLSYLAYAQAHSSALGNMWLGVDAGEQTRLGEAVGFLRWARDELEGLRKRNKDKEKDAEKEGVVGGKEEGKEERETCKAFLEGYLKENDSIHFQSVPVLSELQARRPSGRSAVVVKKFQRPRLAFGEDTRDDNDGEERYF